jgi:hypothetical protein
MVDLAVVGVAAVDLAVGPWVSQGNVAWGLLLSSQTESELVLAGRAVCFPAEVQLRVEM